MRVGVVLRAALFMGVVAVVYVVAVPMVNEDACAEAANTRYAGLLRLALGCWLG